MKRIFADTFYFVALLSPSDSGFEQALAATAHQKNTILYTTAWVLTELANSLSKPPGRAGFLETLASLRADPAVVIIEADRQWFDKGIQLYQSRPDKEWSLTDCISFIVMQEHHITDALTGDHHFTQAGFNALLQ